MKLILIPKQGKPLVLEHLSTGTRMVWMATAPALAYADVEVTIKGLSEEHLTPIRGAKDADEALEKLFKLAESTTKKAEKARIRPW